MKFRSFLFMLFLITILTPKESQAQFNMFGWTDTTTVTTAAVTLTATVPFQTLTVAADTVVIFIKWNSAVTFVRVPVGGSISFGSAEKITSLSIKTEAGTGIVYTAGLKKQTQSGVGF